MRRHDLGFWHFGLEMTLRCSDGARTYGHLNKQIWKSLDEETNLDMVDLPKGSTDAQRCLDHGRGMHKPASSRPAGMQV